MTNPPAFQYYAADFDEDTASWECEEVGIYQRLLNYEWINGWKPDEGLPDDPKRLARIARISYKKFQKRWGIISKKFSRNGKGFLVNRRLEEEREIQREYRQEQARKGKIGADKRWGDDSRGYGRGDSPRNGRKMGLQSSSSSSSFKKEQQIDYSQLQTKTDPLCKSLSGYFKDFNFYGWRQEQVNKQNHPEAIKECLDLLWKNRKGVKKGARPYLTQLMKIKGPNAFERIAMAEHEKRKKDELSYDGKLKELMGEIKENIPGKDNL